MTKRHTSKVLLVIRPNTFELFELDLSADSLGKKDISEELART